MANKKVTSSTKEKDEIKEIKEEVSKENKEVEIKKDIVENDIKSKEEISEEKPKEPWKPDLNRMICIKNITNNDLIYVSKRQIGYTIEWTPKGINYIELSEFMNLKNTDRRFVTEPWIRIMEIDEEEILKYANIYQYYTEILKIDTDIFKLDFEKFKRKFDKLPQGYKDNLAKQCAIMIKNDELDSIKIKKYIEKEMNIDLDILIDAFDANKISSDDYIDF